MRFLISLNKVLQRTGRVLNAAGPKACGRSIKEDLALDLTLLRPGSPAAILGLERKNSSSFVASSGLRTSGYGLRLNALTVLQQAGDTLPLGCDTGVFDGAS